jgi:hypothetical protein
MFKPLEIADELLRLRVVVKLVQPGLIKQNALGEKNQRLAD